MVKIFFDFFVRELLLLIFIFKNIEIKIINETKILKFISLENFFNIKIPIKIDGIQKIKKYFIKARFTFSI